MNELTWRELQTAMANLTESEVAALLIEEVTLHKRAPFITRLHQRYARLRADRERQEILRMTQK